MSSQSAYRLTRGVREFEARSEHELLTARRLSAERLMTTLSAGHRPVRVIIPPPEIRRLDRGHGVEAAALRAITHDGGSHALGRGVILLFAALGRNERNRWDARVARRSIDPKRKQDTRKSRDACRPELVPADASALQSEASLPRNELSYLNLSDRGTGGNALRHRSRMIDALTDPPAPPCRRRRSVTCALLRGPTRAHGGSR
jgi:hypothetical protein